MTDQHDPIWALNVGDVLQARATLYTEDGNRERVFTAGRRYKVLRVLAIRTPAAVIVLDDSDRENKIEASFLDNFTHLSQYV